MEKMKDTYQKGLGVWMNMILADTYIEAAEALDRGTRFYSFFASERHPLNSSVVDNGFISSLIECDIFRSVFENAPVVGRPQHF